jgi:pullulanase/glycogen debranching enzyme
MLLAGDAPRPNHANSSGNQDTTLLVVFNAESQPVTFRTPATAVRHNWTCILDTFSPERPAGTMSVVAGESFTAEAHSLYTFSLVRFGALPNANTVGESS